VSIKTLEKHLKKGCKQQCAAADRGRRPANQLDKNPMPIVFLIIFYDCYSDAGYDRSLRELDRHERSVWAMLIFLDTGGTE